MMERAVLCRTMARKWLESAHEARNPALKKCYTERALRYRMMASMYERNSLTGSSRGRRVPPM